MSLQTRMNTITKRCNQLANKGWQRAIGYAPDNSRMTDVGGPSIECHVYKDKIVYQSIECPGTKFTLDGDVLVISAAKAWDMLESLYYAD